ncbi:virulence factor SrfC family protein [Sodalis sp. RH21]|uniref:virulence factor SrfC family protein n=1 Tax=unclassified Sodalis (in: enterobacteria) TaxID=2636512 RepID=UPI0039B5A5B4
MEQGIGQGIDWIAATRRQAARLDIEADGLTIKLRRCRTRARALSAAALSPMTLGFYGQSQAGKSYLIAALAADANGRLTNVMGGEAPALAGDMPPGPFSSDVVTRFSRRAGMEDKDFPRHLLLLTEVEIAKILATAYRDTAPSALAAPGPQEFADRLDHLQRLRQPEAVAGITSDEVVALWDYLARHDGKPHRFLSAHFWPLAVELAPFLRVDDRARLFAVLWDEEPELTAAYRRFAHALHAFAGAPAALAPVDKTLDDAPPDRIIKARPLNDGRAGRPVELTLAELAMLTVERLIPLQSSPRRPVFEQIDLLDFPGEPPEVADADDKTQPDPWMRRIARAKRAYLLARYTDSREISLLMVCNAAGKPSEIKCVARALDYWVKQTQGATPLVRNRRKPGLIWAVTPFDRRLVQGQNHDDAVQRYVGFPGYAWGTMLVLDAGGVERMADYLLAELRPDARLGRLSEQYTELRRELAENLLGGWYQPAGAEDSRQKPRIADTLIKVLQTRAGVHGELLEKLLPSRGELRRLYLASPSPQPALAAQSASPLPLMQRDDFGVGIFIDLLAEVTTEVTAKMPPPTPAGQQPRSGTQYDVEAGYARRVMRCWINYLRDLPENGPLLALLGLAKPTLEMLLAELIIAGQRLDIESVLLNALIEDIPRERAGDGPLANQADRQVARALTVLGDFVAWLGFQRAPLAQRPDSRVNPGHKIFARMEIPAENWGSPQRLTRLNQTPINTTAFYIFDWLVALKAMILQNAGYSGAGKVGPEACVRLGEILRLIDPDYLSA